MKIRIKKLIKENLETSKLKTIMQKYDIEPGKVLGTGQYGTVYYGVSDDYGPVAIKMLRKGQISTKREIENYDSVNKARSQSKNIAKHFPEVYHIDETDDTYSFIVMEILDVQQGYQHELISILFGGFNTALKPYEDEQEESGTFRSRSNRLYMLFKKEESQQSIFQDFYSGISPDLDFLLPVIKEFFAFIDGYVSNIKDNTASEDSLRFMSLSDKAQTYMYNWVNGEFKTLFKDAPWLLTFIVKQLEALQKEDKSGMLFAQYHESIILYWLDFYRKSSPIGIHDSDPRMYTTDEKGLDQEKWQIFKEASSIKQAIKDLKDIAGLKARDMHDKNVMIRPQTGDVVIVDLGLFKKT